MTTSRQIWKQIEKASFAVLSYVTPRGQARSSGVVYAVRSRRLYVAVARDSWKALHIPATEQVAVTIPVRRGGLLALLLPIPPATISFHARAVVLPDGAVLSKELARLVPAERQATCRVIEILPEGTFTTYGIGVSLLEMREPSKARGRARTAEP